MKPVTAVLLSCCCVVFFSSCEFSCSIGDKSSEKKISYTSDEPRIYNNIKLKATKLKIEKAYLIFDNGNAVPENNAVDFKNPVKMQVKIDSGWVSRDGKVMIGASEKIVTEDGTVLLDEPDLFAANTGVSPEDAKSLRLTASIHVREGSPPTSFTIFFNIWDKNGEGTMEGSYKLYSK